MKKQWHTLLAALMLAGLGCSTSSSDNELSWYAKYTVPIINKSFFISELLNEVFLDSNFFIVDPDTGFNNEGDTFTLHIVKSDLKTYKSKLFDVNELNFNYKFSNFLINDMPIISDTISFIVTEDNVKDGLITISDSIKSDFFKTINFDSLENLISIEIENLSKNLNLEEMKIYLEDFNYLDSGKCSFSSKYENSLIQKFNVSGLKLDSIISYKIVIPVLDSLSEGKELQIAISLDINDLSVWDGDVFDQYVDFSFEQLIYVPITTDGFNLTYIDIDEIFIPFKLKNPFPISFEGAVEFNSMVDLKFSDYSEYGLTTKGKRNNFIFKILENSSDNSFKISNIDVEFKDKRLYGQWDSLFQVCYVPVTVSGTLKPKDEFIKLSKSLEVGVSVEDPITKISQIKGDYKKNTFVEGKPDDFDMPLTDLEKVLSVIRDKVKLTDNQLFVELEFLMPDSSYLSDVNYFCIMMMYADNEVVEDTLSWTMEDIRGGDISTYNFEVNKMVNFFPDSIKYRIDYEFPKGAVVQLTDSLFNNDEGKSVVVMNVNFNLELISSLIWEITESVNVDLGVLKLPVSFNENNANMILKEKVLYTEFDILNQTNFSGKLFGLGMNVNEAEQLQNIEIDSFINFFEELCEDASYITMLGRYGVELPSRGAMKSDTVFIEKNAMGKMLTVDSLAVRLGLQIYPAKLDALVDTDFIKFNASATLEGVQSWDDLE